MIAVLFAQNQRRRLMFLHVHNLLFYRHFMASVFYVLGINAKLGNGMLNDENWPSQ